MIKFDVFNRFSGSLQFTAEIDCEESESRSVKLGLAVDWAIKNGASLEGASLNGASLNRARLNGASLDWASLEGANLDGASLNGASLEGVSLNWANLNRARLNRARLNGASLDGASLDGASLNWASLERVSLEGVSLERVSLERVSGVNDYIKCIQIETWPIAYTATDMQIGCQRHSLDAWRGFNDDEIDDMDDEALEWWRKYRSWIFQTIELCPAKPTQPAQEAA